MIFYVWVCACFILINRTLKLNSRIPAAKYFFFSRAKFEFKTLHLWNLELKYYLCHK